MNEDNMLFQLRRVNWWLSRPSCIHRLSFTPDPFIHTHLILKWVYLLTDAPMNARWGASSGSSASVKVCALARPWFASWISAEIFARWVLRSTARFTSSFTSPSARTDTQTKHEIRTNLTAPVFHIVLALYVFYFNDVACDFCNYPTGKRVERAAVRPRAAAAAKGWRFIHSLTSDVTVMTNNEPQREPFIFILQE